MELVYYKYRQNFSWGSTGWTYMVLKVEDLEGYEDFGDYLDSHNMLNNFSERWRDVEYEKLDTLPKDVLHEKIDNLNAIINDSQRKRDILKGLLFSSGG